jgi:hypothetical protein
MNLRNITTVSGEGFLTNAKGICPAFGIPCITNVAKVGLFENCKVRVSLEHKLVRNEGNAKITF